MKIYYWSLKFGLGSTLVPEIWNLKCMYKSSHEALATIVYDRNAKDNMQLTWVEVEN